VGLCFVENGWFFVELSLPKSHRRPTQSRVFLVVATVTFRNRRHFSLTLKLLPTERLVVDFAVFSERYLFNSEKDLTWVHLPLGTVPYLFYKGTV